MHTGSAEISDKHNLIFKCDQCEKTFKSDTGMKVHNRKSSWEADAEAVETPATIHTTVTEGLCQDVN